MVRGAVFFGLGVAVGTVALAAGLAAGPAPVGGGSAAAPDDRAATALHPDTDALPSELALTVEEARARILAEFPKQGSGSYAGRFAHFAKYGVPGIEALERIAAANEDATAGWALAHLAIQALGDIPHARSLEVLESLADRFDADGDTERGDEAARSLFRLGHRARLEAIIAGLEAQLQAPSSMARPGGGPTPWPTPLRVADQSRLAHRYLHAERYDEAAKMFERGAYGYGGFGVAHYNAACARALGGNQVAAVASLRVAVVGDPTSGERGYGDVDWMREDGDLASIRRLPEFEYLVACCIARNRIGAGWPAADPADVRAALDALARAGGAGYRIEHQEDRLGMLIGLRDHPEFERLWTAMGGAQE